MTKALNISRRDILARAGAVAAGAAALSSAAKSAAMAAELPKGGIIRTALKDVSPGSLTQILAHEHLQGASTYTVTPIRGGAEPPQTPPPDQQWQSKFSENLDPKSGEIYLANCTEDLDLMIQEMKFAGQDGITAIVDCGPPLHWTQRPEYLRQLSKYSGMAVIIGGGYHTQPRYPAEISKMSEEEIVEQFLRDHIPNRWGVMGEIGVSAPITDDEKKVNRAAGRMQALTNLPIISHTANGAFCVEQLDLFEAAGAKAPHILMGHIGGMGGATMASMDQIRTICNRGAFVGFDRVGGRPEADEVLVPIIRNVIDAGFVDHIILSSDGGGSPAMLKTQGGPGWSRAFTVMVPKLRKAGVEEAALRKIMVDNPKRLLAFVPKKA